jgi:hypothetical protein
MPDSRCVNGPTARGVVQQTRPLAVDVIDSAVARFDASAVRVVIRLVPLCVGRLIGDAGQVIELVTLELVRSDRATRRIPTVQLGRTIPLMRGGIMGTVVHDMMDEIGFHAVEDRHYVTDIYAMVLGQKGLEIDFTAPIWVDRCFEMTACHPRLLFRSCGQSSQSLRAPAMSN